MLSMFVGGYGKHFSFVGQAHLTWVEALSGSWQYFLAPVIFSLSVAHKVQMDF